MQSNRAIDWLIIAIIAFLGGVVNNIVVPARRGLIGFCFAAIIGVFVGGVAGMCASEWGATLPVQWSVSAIFGVCGDRILSYVLVRSHAQGITINGGQNVFGNNHDGMHDE